MSQMLPPNANVGGHVPSQKLLISPLEGEMSGRTEGGGLALTLARKAYSACVV